MTVVFPRSPELLSQSRSLSGTLRRRLVLSLCTNPWLLLQQPCKERLTGFKYSELSGLENVMKLCLFILYSEVCLCSRQCFNLQAFAQKDWGSGDIGESFFGW